MREQGEEPEVSSPTPSSSKRLKALSFPPPKGKQTADSEPNPEPMDETCGICLARSTRSIRGRIDGCDHQFCFVCIMEWAKIESRCPLCKRRFWSICRPVTPGLFATERIVKISERDQVYHPLGVESSAINEPNPNTKCTICNSRENEAFLLPCNLCQSAFHTYCTGFGWTVPDSNWCCPDCTVCKTEHERYQPEGTEVPFGQLETLEKIRALKNEDSSVNLYDFVAGTQELVPFSEVAISTCAVNLSNSRRLQNRINSIRANWDLMRAGDLEFKPGFVSPNSGERKRNKNTNGAILVESSRNRDVNKAWRMMAKAKPVINQKKVLEKTNVNSWPHPLNVGIGKPVCHQKTQPSGIGKPVFHQKTQPSGIGKPVFHQKTHPTGIGKPGFHQINNVKMLGKLERREDSAKSEVQSLVKQNLKIFGNKLGVDRFKEVARISTHSILAACGFNHSESVAQNFSMLPCYHNEAIKSDIMPNSCNECFNSFVYEVVKSVLSE